MQLARGLAAAHARAIIHRDLKPGNLRVTPERVLKILDFGLAQLFVAPDDETATESLMPSDNSIAGTLPYMAPEQLQGKSPDARSDVYSAGVVLYEMATGSRPFAEHGVLLRQAILTSRPRSPRQSTPALSPKLEAVILRCLEKDPGTRFQSASELLAELAHVAAEQNVALPSTLSAIAKPGAKKKIWASASVAALLIAFVGGYLFWHTPKAEAHQKIMAVLPFDEVGQSSATSALGAGLMETVATKLFEAGDEGMVEIVAPHELREKGVKSAADARREFGTDMVLEGSLQQSGQELRITCNLVDSRTGRELGARTITRDVNDIFSLQDETVKAAWDMLLAAHLAVQHTEASPTQPETQPAAYEAYIRGKGFLEEYEKSENIDSAIVEFKKAIDIDPNYALAYAALGNAYAMELQQSSRGKEWVTRASQSCDKSLSLNPELVEGHICLANIFNATGKYEKAIEQFNKAVQADPNNEEALRGLAQAHTNAGNFEAAERAYKEAISVRANYWGTYSKIGAFYYGQSRYSDAAEMFRKAIQLAPDNYQEYFNLSAAYTFEGRYSDGINASKRSLELRPTPDAYGNLGYTYFLLHRYSDAIPTLESALKLDQDDWQNWGNLADALYWSPDRRPEAVAAYQKAVSSIQSKLDVNPNDSFPMAYLAHYYAMLGDKQAALKYSRQALQLSAPTPEVLFAVALTYSELGETEKAVSMLQRAADAGSSRPVIGSTPDFAALKQNRSFASIVGSE